MQKQKVRKMFFIDGFNLYHAIERAYQNDINFINTKWLDLEKLCSFFIDTNIEILAGIKYFTTLSWKSNSLAKQQIYISALLAHAHSIEMIYGKFKQKNRHCSNCNSSYIGHEEKLTDVNIAIYLLENALKNTFDEAVIVSADSDLIPAILAVKRNFPGKKVSVLPPFANMANDLKNNVDKKYKMTARQLFASQLPNVPPYIRPKEWDAANYTLDTQTDKWVFNPKQ